MSRNAIRVRKHQVLRFLNSDEFGKWTIRLSQKSLTLGTHHFAEVSVADKLIIINPHKTVVQLIESVVHEVLHILFPTSRESTILRWEQQVITDMSPSEMTDVLYTIFSRRIVVWDE